MVITKLMHMKESPGCPYNHLRSAIYYILDVKHNGKKTGYGALVGGNSGTDHKEILENFLETKRAFGKTDGRQGYHFVISFAKGEADEMTAYDVIREFCEEYLGDRYDYVFAVHIDKAHMHGHVIFNSVSRVDGYKYHYQKGDWEREIQPVTDRICVEHQLSPLTFEDERVGVSYASWAAEKKGDYNWSHIIRADIDYAVWHSKTFEEFQEIMEQMNYTLRFGHSKKLDKDYITYTFTSEDGKQHRRRSYHFPAGYSREEIMQRIVTKEGSKSYEEIMRQLEKQTAGYLRSGVLKSMRTYTRLYQAVSYYKLPNPFAVPAHRVRKDMIRIDKLLEECRYLKDNKVKSRASLEQRQQWITKKLEQLLAERRKLYAIHNQMGEEQLAAMEQYHELQKKMLLAKQEGSSRFEEIDDRIADMEKIYPHDLLEGKGRIEAYGKEIAGLRKELRLLKRILDTEKGQEQPVQGPRLKG